MLLQKRLFVVNTITLMLIFMLLFTLFIIFLWSVCNLWSDVNLLLTTICSIQWWPFFFQVYFCLWILLKILFGSLNVICSYHCTYITRSKVEMRNYFINSKTFNFSFTDTLIRLHLYTSKFVFSCLDMCVLLYSSISPD